jgi:hypothetical protein
MVFDEKEFSLYDEDWKFVVEGLLEEGPPNAASRFAKEDLLDRFRPNSDSPKGVLLSDSANEKSLFFIM